MQAIDDAFNTTINLSVNGAPQTVTVDVRASLLDMLRERLQLTGTKKGCDHGQCGASFVRGVTETGTNQAVFRQHQSSEKLASNNQFGKENTMKKITKTLLAGSVGVATGILVLVGVLFLGSNAVAQTGDSMNTKLTIVFVHGLWAGRFLLEQGTQSAGG